MAYTYTANIKLVKPGYDNSADIAVINSNMDKIDAAYKTVDAVKLGGKPPEAYSAVNLLDNSNFLNPVNQRGNTSCTNANEHPVDRWKLAYAPNEQRVDVTDSGLVITSFASDGYANIVQVTEFPDAMIGKTMTFAVKTAESGILVLPIAYGTNNAGRSDDGTLEIIHFSGTGFFIRVYGIASRTVEWAALYEGAYTAETIPPYVPKPYSVELAECQRYYENSWFGISKETQYQLLGLAWNVNSFDCQIYFNQVKRIIPTMTYYPSGGAETVRGFFGGITGYRDVTIESSLARLGTKGIYARVSVPEADMTVSGSYQLHAHWEANADL